MSPAGVVLMDMPSRLLFPYRAFALNGPAALRRAEHRTDGNPQLDTDSGSETNTRFGDSFLFFTLLCFASFFHGFTGVCSVYDKLHI